MRPTGTGASGTRGKGRPVSFHKLRARVSRWAAPTWPEALRAPIRRCRVAWLRVSSVDSSGGRNNLGEPLGWCHPAQGLSRPFVELSGDRVKLTLGHGREVAPLGQVLAEQPVGVLVRTTLPGAVGVAEVHLDAGVHREGLDEKGSVPD